MAGHYSGLLPPHKGPAAAFLVFHAPIHGGFMTGSVRNVPRGEPSGRAGLLDLAFPEGLGHGSLDPLRSYYAIANFNSTRQAMTNPPPGTPAVSFARSWGAIDPATGEILWQT